MWLVTLLSFQYVSCAKIAQTNAGLCHVTVEIYETQNLSVLLTVTQKHIVLKTSARCSIFDKKVPHS